jgi:hypothetical protein
MSHPFVIMKLMSSHTPPDVRIARIAGRQHGLVTRAQLTAAGLTRGQVRGRIATGALAPIGRHVYRATAAPRSWEQSALAACLDVGSDAVLSGRSAATAWRLDLPPARLIEVSAPGRRARSATPEGIRLVRVQALAGEDRTVVGRLPVTTLPRTLIDLAGDLQPSVLVRVVDAAIVAGAVTPLRVHLAIERLGARGRKGIGTLRDALSAWLDDQELTSVAEAACLRLLRLAGLPEPEAQYAVLRPDGTTARLDFAWPAARTALDVDGFRWHETPRAHARDSRRANDLAAMGWTLLRATPVELASAPGSVLDALRLRLSPAQLGRNVVPGQPRTDRVPRSIATSVRKWS